MRCLCWQGWLSPFRIVCNSGAAAVYFPRTVGLIDFAGSGNVHMMGGGAALMGAMALGPRVGRFTEDGSVAYMRPNNPTSQVTSAAGSHCVNTKPNQKCCCTAGCTVAMPFCFCQRCHHVDVRMCAGPRHLHPVAGLVWLQSRQHRCGVSSPPAKCMISSSQALGYLRAPAGSRFVFLHVLSCHERLIWEFERDFNLLQAACTDAWRWQAASR